jgi:cytidylate kinase
MSTSTEERRRGGIASSQVEYQMRFRDIMARAGARAPTELDRERVVGPFVSVSRQAGSGGAEVARRIGERLGWAVLDKELVERLAGDLKLEPRLLALLDEKRANWFSETLLNLFNSRLVEQRGYVELLGKVMALAALAEPVVIVGRGAHLVLPREHGFCVRIIAARAARVQRLSRSTGLSETAAEKRLDEIDANRRGYIRRNFRQDVADPSLYDLVVNTGSFGVDQCVELIIQAMELRGVVSNPHAEPVVAI